jgi:hypothetical protein
MELHTSNAILTQTLTFANSAYFRHPIPSKWAIKYKISQCEFLYKNMDTFLPASMLRQTAPSPSDCVNILSDRA